VWGASTPLVASSGAVAATVGYEVRRVRNEREMKGALKLRHDVFCVEQGVPQREEVDGRDPDGIHLVAVPDGCSGPAGCC